MNNINCPLPSSKPHIPMNYINMAIDNIRQGISQKLNCIWLETSGCFGEIIALLDGENPGLVDLLTDMVNMTFFNSIMADSGEAAYQRILDTINTDEPYLFIVSGAIPLRSDGRYAVIANYNGEIVTALDAVRTIVPRASYIIAAGTCTSFGGPTSARPNISQAVRLDQLIDLPIINVPGCPVNPIWILGTIAHIINFGMPELDTLNRPETFYGITIHERCPRRSFFDYGIFATEYGQPECMFKLGCRGPITRTTCPLTRWNESDNWPIGTNTNCIGCAGFGFPDLMEPFIRY
ncbi:hydrogenase small subunit [Cellulosilyticum sp. I15G10I2]|uniref:hydrogenase small subunit n=1 Tax=Cellulosilyticum sp. I15G10I2 TaxID=1892843 RepID=UPI000AC4E2C1|nr:hydrogenase small subunit [Cellulosilyticum sp. I15G10I2]